MAQLDAVKSILDIKCQKAVPEFIQASSATVVDSLFISKLLSALYMAVEQAVGIQNQADASISQNAACSGKTQLLDGILIEESGERLDNYLLFAQQFICPKIQAI